MEWCELVVDSVVSLGADRRTTRTGSCGGLPEPGPVISISGEQLEAREILRHILGKRL